MKKRRRRREMKKVRKVKRRRKIPISILVNKLKLSEDKKDRRIRRNVSNSEDDWHPEELVIHFYNLSSMLTQCVFPSPEITKQFLITVL
jgi:hypothetical protein